MMRHLGGPEAADKIAERQSRYARQGSDQFKVVDAISGEGVGWVGAWDRERLGDRVYEVGWSVIPSFQGRGIARAATEQLLGLVAPRRKHRYAHAYPSVANAASNAVCRAVGFEYLGQHEVEFPKGSFFACNDWRFDLSTVPRGRRLRRS